MLTKRGEIDLVIVLCIVVQSWRTILAHAASKKRNANSTHASEAKTWTCPKVRHTGIQYVAARRRCQLSAYTSSEPSVEAGSVLGSTFETVIVSFGITSTFLFHIRVKVHYVPKNGPHAELGYPIVVPV